MDTSPNLPIPRLRLTRHSPPSRADTLNTPTAGPSHLRTSPETLRAHLYDEEDADATPRMPTVRIADSPEATVAPTLPLDTPAARLRMVLARVPNNRSPPRASTSRLPEPATPSEPDSDLDPPYSITATPSIAKESLREIFSHALRGSETTPQKSNRRARRNSIGPVSEVDPSPRVERVQQERVRHKGKRRSMSDEEAEHLSNLSRRSEESAATSRSGAARWDALNAVLTGGQSSTMPPTPPPERMITNMTMPPSDTTEDNATLLRELREPELQSSPPHPTGTPTRTLQMSGQFGGQSNLLEGDSEMRKALGGMDSYDGDSMQNGHAPPFPPSSRSRLTSPPSTRPTSWSSHHKTEPSSTTRPASASARPISWSPNPKSDPVSPGRPLSWNSHSKSHSTHNLQMPLSRRGSEELEHSTSSLGSSRASSSSQSAADYKERHDDLERDRLRERERLWNHRQPKSPAHTQHIGHGSDGPVHTHSLARKGSAASLNSLHSTDDGRSSRASSVMSQAEQQERVKELQTERIKEREYGWNKPKHTPTKSLTRSASSLNLRAHERPRTLSSVTGYTPPRPDSAQSLLSPHSLTPAQPRRSLSRQSSANSLRSAASGDSRAPSPALSNIDTEPEEERGIVHERERNWNSPRPQWGEHNHGRSPSPLPESLPASPSAAKTGSPSPRERKDSSASLSHVSGRQRTQSLRTSPAPTSNGHTRARTPSSISFDVKGKTPLTARRLGVPRASPGPPSRSPSPVRASQDESEAKAQPSGFGSRFGWSFPVNRTPLPPLELDTEPDSPVKPRASTPSRLSLKNSAASHIPRPSSALGDASAAKKRGHKRSITELSKPTGPVPPPATPPSVRHDEEEDGDSEISIEIDTGSDPEPEPEGDEESRFPSFHADSQMDAVFASDEDSPPATSTPTARPVPLPPPSPWSPVPSASETPFTTPSSRPNDTRTNDSETSRNVPPPETPPYTPADTIPAPIFSLQTPPRRSPGNGSSGSFTKLEFKTPSPPRGMPDLPDPPSFLTDEGEPQSDGEGENDNTPVMTSAPGNFTMMKTPRPPGAWAATPDVRRPEDSFPGKAAVVGDDSSASSVLVNTPDGQAKVDVVATAGGIPGLSGSNTTATWPRTPAPPGAWLQTPGGPASVRRRSILKVRFDVESETTVSDIGESSNETKRPALPAAWNPNAEQDSSTEGALAMPPIPATSQDEDRKAARAETPNTPPSKAVRPFRSPGSVSVRIVDAFGRETKPEDEQLPRRAQNAPTLPKTPERKTQQTTALSTPRSRSAVRIVDAMGREVEEPEPAASNSHELNVHVPEASMQSISMLDDEGSSVISVDMPTPTTHNEALELVRENVKNMKKEARQAEKNRSYRELALDDGRARALQDASNKARNARRSISQELQRMEGADAERSWASRYAPLKESMRRTTSRFLPPALSEATVKLSWSRGAWLFWAFVLVQLGLCLVMYRLSNVRARRLFLTTYYDQFYSDLYIAPRAPSAANPSAIPPYPSWYEIPAMVARRGWHAALYDMWNEMMCALSLGSCGQSAPDVWHNAAPGQMNWPPT